MVRNSIVSLLLSISAILASQKPLQVPPGDIPVEQAPMFISFGFDDNSHSGMPNSTSATGGVKWVCDFTKDLVNPAGNGQAATFDGSPVRCTFYSNSFYFEPYNGDYANLVKWSHSYAYQLGHEMGNHTHSHLTNHQGPTMSVAAWEAEIDECSGWLTKPAATDSVSLADDPANGAGVDINDIVGLRSPFLFYGNNTFKAIKNKGMHYDCSIEEGLDPEQDGTNFYWPYTLDHESPGHRYMVDVAGTKEDGYFVPEHPDVWELPCYAVVVPKDEDCAKYGIPTGLRKKLDEYMATLGKPGSFDSTNGKITGLDYNWYYFQEFNLSKDEALAILKHTLDLRMEGNRCPMLLGVHSQFYASFWNGNAKACPNPEDRQAILEEFVAYALEKYSAVRIVPMKDVMEWCKNPVPLSGTAVTTQKKQGNTRPLAIKDTHITLRSSERQLASLYTLNGKRVLQKSLTPVNGICSWDVAGAVAAGKYVVKIGNLTAALLVE